MDSVKKSVTCQICQKLYNNPVYLPCNNTVCQCHVEEILKQKHDDPANLDIPCFLCKNSHSTQYAKRYFSNSARGSPFRLSQ